MQAAENSKVFLKTIDGGLARVTLRTLAGAAAAGDVDFLDTVGALGRVLAAFDTGLALDPAPVVHGAGFDAGLLVSGVLPAGSPTLTARRVRAFAPAISARTRGLDLLVLSSPEAAASGDAATVAAAAAFARRLGRERLCVVIEDGADAKAAVAGIAAADCPMAIEAQGLSEVCGRLAAGAASYDALLVPDAFLETVSAVAAGVAGSAGLVTECASHEDAVIVSAGLAGDSALPTLPGIVLAVAELLAVIGRVELGARLADAWCRAIESGVHTSDFEVTHPYARLVDDAEFADALIDLMGEVPRTLRRQFDRLPVVGRAKQSARPAMRVIQGGR